MSCGSSPDIKGWTRNTTSSADTHSYKRWGYRNDTGAVTDWKGVIDAVHDAGGRMAPLWHAGSTKHLDWEPASPVESPSGLLAPGKPRGEAMSEKAIADIVATFAKAAAEAKRLGFDEVEVEGGTWLPHRSVLLVGHEPAPGPLGRRHVERACPLRQLDRRSSSGRR